MRIQYLKIIQLTCFRICFVKQSGGGVTFFKGSERGDVPRVGGVTFFKGSERGDVPRVGGSRFLRDPKGGRP